MRLGVDEARKQTRLPTLRAAKTGRLFDASATYLSQPLANASTSALMVSASVMAMPCGKPG